MRDPDSVDAAGEREDESSSTSPADRPRDVESPSGLPREESWRDVRPVALGVVRRDDDLLVFELRDAAAEETCYRPPGGGVHFGEPAAAAVVREFEEELGWTVEVEERLATLENRFRFDGTAGHEYDLVFAVEPADEAVYEADEFVATESNGDEYRVRFKPLSDFESPDAPPLYPDGLLDLLR